MLKHLILLSFLMLLNLGQVQGAALIGCEGANSAENQLQFDRSLDETLYSDVLRWSEQLRTKFAQQVQIHDIGQSSGWLIKEVEGYWFYYKWIQTPAQAIKAIQYLPEGKVEGQILITAGAHATETSGPRAALEFFNFLMSSELQWVKKVRKSYIIRVIPVIDVDQWSLPFTEREYSMLTNNFYHKLDREGPLFEGSGKFSQVLGPGGEAKSVAAAIEKWQVQAPIVAAFDLHEAADKNNKEGLFEFTPVKFKRQDLIDYLIRSFKRRNLPLAWGSWQKHIWRIDNPSTLSDFLSLKKAMALTQEVPRWDYETEKVLSDDRRIELHIEALKLLTEATLFGIPQNP